MKDLKNKHPVVLIGIVVATVAVGFLLGVQIAAVRDAVAAYLRSLVSDAFMSALAMAALGFAIWAVATFWRKK